MLPQDTPSGDNHTKIDLSFVGSEPVSGTDTCKIRKLFRWHISKQIRLPSRETLMAGLVNLMELWAECCVRGVTDGCLKSKQTSLIFKNRCCTFFRTTRISPFYNWQTSYISFINTHFFSERSLISTFRLLLRRWGQSSFHGFRPGWILQLFEKTQISGDRLLLSCCFRWYPFMGS